jgi:hypothetical protein
LFLIFVFSSSILDASKMNLLEVNFASEVLTEADMPGISLGGKRAAATVKSGSGISLPVATAVQVLRKMMSVLKSTILCVRDMVIAVEPQLNKVNRSINSIFCFSSVVGRKHWSVLKLGSVRISERVVVVCDSMKKTPSSLQ